MDRCNGGHILPEETIVAESFAVEAFGIDGAMFVAEPDAETNFKLFGPVARAPARRVKAAAAPLRCGCGRTRILPRALESFCRQRGILRARIHGGVGSHHRRALRRWHAAVVPFATELAISAGTDRAGGRRRAAGAARRRAGGLSRRPRRGAGWCAATIRC